MIVRIADEAVMAGTLPTAKRRAILGWAEGSVQSRGKAWENQMMRMHRIEAAQMLPELNLFLTFDDGFSGVANLAETARKGGALMAIRSNPDGFAIASGGRSIVWLDAAGDEVDLCADALRIMAEAAAAKAAE